jgi:integrase
MGERRLRGEGGIYQRHDHPSCPPLVAGERAAHNCRGRWVGVVDLGRVKGKRVRKTVTGTTLREVQRKFKDLKKRTDSGVDSENWTVERWMEHWLRTHVEGELRDTTAAMYRRNVKRWIIPTLGKTRLDRLRPEQIESLYADMRDEGLSDSSRRQVHAILRRALRIAEEQRRIEWNPAAKAKAPAVGKKTHGKFTLEEARTVLSALDQHDVRASRWACAMLAGLRQGEALGLRWEDVAWDQGEFGYLLVQRSVQQVPGKGLQVLPLKSEASYRGVPMVEPVRILLEREKQAEGYIWGAGDKPRAPRPDWAEWKALLKTAGAPDRPLHAARATTASLLMEAGVSEKVIAEIMGHSQVQVTRRHYLSGDDSMHSTAMGRLGDLIGWKPAELG